MTARLSVLFLLLGLVGCAAGNSGPNGKISDCTLGIALVVTPATATADHAAEPPDNQQQFASTVEPTALPGCPSPQWVALGRPQWTSSQPADMSISSANDPTNGLAVCTAATDGPATLTATETMGGNTATTTATLTCK